MSAPNESTAGVGVVVSPAAPAAPPPAAVSQPSAPAPAPESSPQRPIESLSAAERQEWRKTGKVPAAAPPPENLDAPATDTQGKPVVDAQGKTISKRQARINEQIAKSVGDAVSAANAEIARLKDELTRRTAPAESVTPPTQPTQPTAPKGYTGLEAEPELKDFKLEAFQADEDPYAARLAAFTRAHHRWTVANAAVVTQARQSAEKVFTTYVDREKAYKASRPDFDTKTLAVRQQLNMTSPLSRAVVTSDVGPQLIEHFADHPDDFARIGQLGMTDLPAALLALGRLAAKYDGSVASPSPTVPAASAPAEQVPPKTESSAPPPNPTLGTRSAESTTDPATAAFVRGDFAAGRRLRNQQLAQERAGMR